MWSAYSGVPPCPLPQILHQVSQEEGTQHSLQRYIDHHQSQDRDDTCDDDVLTPSFPVSPPPPLE